MNIQNLQFDTNDVINSLGSCLVSYLLFIYRVFVSLPLNFKGDDIYITSTSRGLHATPVGNPLPLSDGNEGFGEKCMFIHAMKFYII